MAKRNLQFQTVRTEGAILPPDILRRIASQKVDGATPDAYHLPPGSKLNEAISQSWTSLLSHWQAFQEARANSPDSDETGTSITNERWLLPLFKELEYGRLVTTKSPEIDDRVYPIERFYNHTPIHLIGCKLPLDRRTRGARGAATASPHSMVQEYLNRSDNHLWAFLSNGLQLRILRDNISLSRQTFVEFDLEAMMEGEVYPDFALLWLLCHQSRVESDKPTDCWLENWSHLAREQGTRVLNDLRGGVQNAIEALGRGFIGHPRNDRLREKLRTGALSTDDFYRQLLRSVYRLLFLFVAEDRELLHPPGADPAACELYDKHYSTRRLRDLAHKIRGSKHADLWHSLSLVFDALGRNEGRPELGLGGLGSFLWRASSTADLRGPGQIENPPPSQEGDGGGLNDEPALITNDDLLLAIRHLAWTEQDRASRQVDYRNLGSEELGSVYESLLELHPVMNASARAFDLSTAAGNERKTTGSYYTPDSLVQCLLDSALDPVVEDRLKGKKGEAAEQAILAMKVCDPACGSGHFLIAAAHRLARHLARVRTGESEPSPEEYQHALRDVIGRCLYGVDINPMAVELCKVSLWMEAIEPGKPLSFLDHHIQCGNSLLGTTPALLANGIPDDAFKPIEGDDKEVCKELKKDNKRERKEYEKQEGELWGIYGSDTIAKFGNMPAVLAQIDSGSDESVEAIAAKQERYEEFVRGANYLNARLLADVWCSAFVWKKDKSDLGNLCPTERDLRRCESNPHSVLPAVREEIQSLANQYQFFHWHLAFPDVFVLPGEAGKAENENTGWSGGFDVLLANPPWEHVELKEKEWFSSRRADIAEARTSAKRKQLIRSLESEDPSLFAAFCDAKRDYDCTSRLISGSGLFPLCGRGRINSYAIFAELMTIAVSSTGRLGAVLPSGVATDDTTKYFFQSLVDQASIVSLFDFENKLLLFPNVAPVMQFCALTISGRDTQVEGGAFAFFCHDTTDILDAEKRFTLSQEDFTLLNPNTKTCPIFRSSKDAELSKLIYRRVPILINESKPEGGNPWQLSMKQGLFNMTTGSKHFTTFEDCEGSGAILNGNEFVQEKTRWLPLYEAKLFFQFNHRNGTFEGVPTKDRFKTKAATKPLNAIDPRAANEPPPTLATYWKSGGFQSGERGHWPREDQ